VKKIRVVEISAVAKDEALEQVLNKLINEPSANNRVIIFMELKYTRDSLEDSEWRHKNFYRVVYQDDA
jgi:hypothetical protein